MPCGLVTGPRTTGHACALTRQRLVAVPPCLQTAPKYDVLFIDFGNKEHVAAGQVRAALCLCACVAAKPSQARGCICGALLVAADG